MTTQELLQRAKAAKGAMALAGTEVKNRALAAMAEGLEARLILQVHDELIVECPEGEAEQVRALLQEEMEGVAALSVPLVADAKAGRTWAECH